MKFTHWKPPSAFWYLQFFLQIVIKRDNNIYCPNFSDEFYYEGTASLNMRTIDHLMSPFIWHSCASNSVHVKVLLCCPRPWFNIKMPSYWKSHCGDKTAVRSSYLHNGISYTGKMASLYWISPLQGLIINMIIFSFSPGSNSVPFAT